MISKAFNSPDVPENLKQLAVRVFRCIQRSRYDPEMQGTPPAKMIARTRLQSRVDKLTSKYGAAAGLPEVYLRAAEVIAWTEFWARKELQTKNIRG